MGSKKPASVACPSRVRSDGANDERDKLGYQRMRAARSGQPVCRKGQLANRTALASWSRKTIHVFAHPCDGPELSPADPTLAIQSSGLGLVVRSSYDWRDIS